MRARLIATFVLVALLGVGSVGGYSFYQYQRDLHERVDDQYAAHNQVVAREIEAVLAEIRGDLLVAASVPPIQGIVRARDGGGYDQEGESRYDEWTRGLEGIFAAIETANPRYMQLRFLDEQGNELVRVDWDGQQARPIAPAELQNKADRPYFQETMQLVAGQIYVSPLDLNQEWGQIVAPQQPTIRLATPIFNRQGERRGLVVLNVLGQAILHQPSALPEGEGSYIFLTDQRGYYLHHSASPEKEWGGPENSNTGYSLQSDFPQIAGQILSGRAGEVYAGPWAIFYQPVQIDPLHDQFLVLGLAVPTRLIQASMNRYLWFFGGILALSLLLAVGMGYFAAGRITAPLEALRRGARQIADGRFDQRVQVGGTVEISDLADDFNQMAGQVETLYNSLQAEYQRLFESANDSIFIHDLNGRFLAVNENAARSLGYTRDELLRLSVQDLDTPEAAARVAVNLQLLMEQGSLIIESAHRRKDGSAMPVEISATLVEHRGKRAVLSFARDITKRKRDEEQLRLQSAALEAAANSIVISDRQGIIRWVNPAFTRMTGYTFDEALGQSTRLLKSGKHTPSFYQDLWETISAGRVWRGEMINRRKDGSLYTEEQTIAPVQDSRGEISHFIAIKQEITERKQAEAEITRRLTMEQVLSSVSARFVQVPDLASAINLSLEEMSRLIGADRGYLFQFSEGGRTMDNTHEWCSEGTTPQIQNLQGLDTDLFPWWIAKLRQDENVAIPDVAQLPPEARAEKEILQAQEIRSLLAVPLYCAGQWHGFLGFDDVQSTRTWLDEDVRLLRTAAEIIGRGIERTQAETALHQEVWRAEGLRHIGEAINSTLDLDTLLQTVADQTRTITGADYAEIHFGEVHVGEGDGRFTRVLSSGFDPATCKVKDKPSLAGLNGEIFRTQKPVRLDDRTQHPRSVPLPEGHLEIGPFLGVPVIVGGKCIADIMLTRRPSGRPFTEADERAAVTIANQAAVAIQNAQLYQQATASAASLAAVNRRLLALDRVGRTAQETFQVRNIFTVVVEELKELGFNSTLALT